MFWLLLSSHCTSSRPFCFSHSASQQVGWRCARSLEETQTGQMTQIDQKDHAGQWNSRKEEGREYICGHGICFPMYPLGMLRLYFHEVVKHLPTDGKQGMNSFFALMACTILLHLLIHLYLRPWVFMPSFYFLSLPILSLHPAVVENDLMVMRVFSTIVFVHIESLNNWPRARITQHYSLRLTIELVSHPSGRSRSRP